jgi:hypothetical protein
MAGVVFPSPVQRTERVAPTLWPGRVSLAPVPVGQPLLGRSKGLSVSAV